MTDLRIVLRDRKPELADAWREAFGDNQKVQVSHGDIFDVRADAIISPANSFGFMDGGIDLVYSQKFGWDLQERLQQVLTDEHYGELPVGQAAIIETDDPDIPFLISAPTMRVPAIVDETPNAYLAFRAALIAVLRHNETQERKIGSVLSPGLGTAVGRMPVERAAEQMALAYRLVIERQPWAPKSLRSAMDDHRRLVSDGG